MNSTSAIEELISFLVGKIILILSSWSFGIFFLMSQRFLVRFLRDVFLYIPMCGHRIQKEQIKNEKIFGSGRMGRIDFG